jgi:hypothetical protein
MIQNSIIWDDSYFYIFDLRSLVADSRELIGDVAE